MRLVIIAAVLAVAVPLSAARADGKKWSGGHGDDRVVLDRSDVLRRLAEVERLMEEAADEGNKKRRRELVRRAERELSELKGMTRDAPRVRDVLPPAPPAPPPPPGVVRPPPPPPPPPRPVVYPISTQGLAQLKGALSREAFPKDRLRVLESAAGSQYFVVAQIKEVLAMFEFPKDRLRAMELLKPRMLDPENGYHLYASFEFPADKAKLKQLLES